MAAIHLLNASPLSPAAQKQKLSITALRKSLRLLLDEKEFDSDISYVYSGYAPLSIRLVQCVVQKGSLLAHSNANQAASNQLSTTESAEDSEIKKSAQKVRAHPIVGWQGFEETSMSLPGTVFDEIQTPDGQPAESAVPTQSRACFLRWHTLFST